MKDFEQKLKEDDEIQIIAEQDERKEMLLKTLFPKRGHSVFKKCLSTGVVSLAEVKYSDILKFDKNFSKGKPKQTRKGKLNIEYGFVYGTFLNLKNAKEKL